jgi:hypothetical protein
LVVGGGKDGYVKSGNVKLSTTVSGITGPTAWNANGYLLQGFPGITSDKHLHNFDRLGIDVGEARALGGLANLTLLAAPNVSVTCVEPVKWPSVHCPQAWDSASAAMLG